MISVKSILHSNQWRIRFLAGLITILTLWWSSPLWLNWHKTGSYDWGYVLNTWEWRWKTLFHYHQWPAHNPWQAGGVPVNPALGYFSVQALATLVLGAKTGLDIFIIFYLLLGLWGFWRLGTRLFQQQPLAAAFLATLGTASPALALHLAAGHLIFANILTWPAIIYYLMTAAEDRWSGVKAGLLFSLGFNELPFYVMQYGGLVTGALWLRQWAIAPLAARRQLCYFAIISVITALPFMIPPLIGIVTIAADYARVANTPASFSAADLWNAYFSPVTEMKNGVFVPTMNGWWGTWEINCYLGVGATVFFVFGLLNRPRWFHVATAACFLLTIGNLYWWEPMRWLMATPLFASLQTFNRLRMFTHLFFSIGAAWGFSFLWQKAAAAHWIRPVLILAACASVMEILLVSHSITQHSHCDFVLPEVKNEHDGDFYQINNRRNLPAMFGGWPSDVSLYTRANIGVVNELAAIDSAFRYPSRSTCVRTVNDPAYVGEFSQAGHPVRPDYWSPNRITFSKLDPSTPLVVNLNRGRPWFNFEQPLFPHDRIVEFGKPFLVEPNAAGTVVLTYHLPCTTAAWIASIVSALAALLIISVTVRRERQHTKLLPQNMWPFTADYFNHEANSRYLCLQAKCLMVQSA